MDLRKGLERGPFSDKQSAQLGEALAGLDSGQLQWLSGFFAGLSHSAPAIASPDAAPAAAAIQAPKLQVLFGSHTGNCETLAKNLAQAAKERGIEVEINDMTTFKSRDLKKISNLAILVSTHGIGEPPVQAEDLYNFLHGKKAPDLSHVKYSVLALGDSSYVDFCQTGKDFDAILEKLGAQRLSPRVDCDVDFEDEAEAWKNNLLQLLNQTTGTTATAIAVTGNGQAQNSQPQYTRKNPFEATILEKINLNGKGSSKETIHLELDLGGSGLNYEPGDALGVYGANPPALIEGVLRVTNLSGDEEVESHSGLKTLKEALTYDYELTPLSSISLAKYADISGSKTLKSVLEDNEKVLNYLPGRDLLDLLKEVPYKLKAAELLSVLRKNTPRMYSIASAQETVEDEVHLLVSVVRYEAFGRCKEGLCSSTLASRLEVDDKVKVFVDKNSRFKLPENPDTPIIMVGPGTGVAPFRAFMQQREAAENKGKSWLFFGDRNFTTDFLYQTEWQQYLKEGILTKADVAFSRDQKQKHYVQHKMLDQGKELYDWLENGAHFYVCGDAKLMAKDVDNALREIIQTHGGITPEKAQEYIKYLQVSNRYQTDIY